MGFAHLLILENPRGSGPISIEARLSLAARLLPLLTRRRREIFTYKLPFSVKQNLDSARKMAAGLEPLARILI
jgi:hypothetical protein